jgi:clan AA aspartic protease (TIGR02281 family)
LDTGASLVMLSKDVAKKIGINLDKVKPDMKVIMADGRQANAKQIILDSIRVENVEAEKVEAAVLLDQTGELGFGDGLLGMSFLKKFNFKIDQKDKKLILEKL